MSYKDYPIHLHTDEGLHSPARIEVESNSTASLPISFPYLYIAEHNNSFDTFNLLKSPTSDVAPKYPNTQHASPHKQHPALPHKSTQQSELSGFNQVPKRFSQFILDQQNPYMAQRLDNLSIASPSLNSDYDLIKKPHNHKRTSSRKTSNSKPSKSESHSHTLSREISNSMGSQATIFSTRPDVPVMNNGSKSRSMRFRRARSTKVRARLQSGTSSVTSLTRSNAIRFKKGSIFYRIQARLKKFAARIKRFRFGFLVSSKRSGSAQRTKSKSLQRKSLRKASRPVISAPNTNPELGLREAQRVQELTDALKFSAGAPAENVNLAPENNSSHLDHYIDSQHQSYARQYVMPKSEPASIEPIQESWNEDEENEAASEAASEAPPPPPHLEQHSYTAPVIDEVKEEVSDLWRSYLAQVVCKRIQLRQEIFMFQEFMASKAAGYIPYQESVRSVTANDEEVFSAYNASENNASEYNPSEANASQYVESNYNSSEYTATTTNSDKTDVFVDPPAHEFKNTYLNRRSMLGEMLEYDSDGESTTSEATQISDISVTLKTYGTVKRKSRFASTSSSTLTVSTIRRSEGHYNLNTLQ